jgi:hypothetical protein
MPLGAAVPYGLVIICGDRDRLESDALKAPGVVIACAVVVLGYGPPEVVPHWNATLAVVAVPMETRLPFNSAEFAVMLVALPVVTAGELPYSTVTLLNTGE